MVPSALVYVAAQVSDVFRGSCRRRYNLNRSLWVRGHGIEVVLDRANSSGRCNLGERWSALERAVDHEFRGPASAILRLEMSDLVHPNENRTSASN